MNKVQVEILGLSSSPSAGGAYALLLKESFGLRRLPIIIGAYEAQAIALEIEGIKPPRPLTHDLLKNIIVNLGGTVSEIVIDSLRENTFYAKIILEISSLTNEIDTRPSDAIALAVRTGSPIYVSEEVMKTAAFIPSGEEESEKESESLFDDSYSEDEEENSSTYEEPKQTSGKASTDSKIAVLQEKLREAIEKEDYERAAILRDEISKLQGTNN